MTEPNRTGRAMRFLVGIPMLLGGLLSACGVPTGDASFEEIPTEEIPFDLDATSTSTSTSTTSTTIPLVPVTTNFDTTTTVPVEEVFIYFLSRSRLRPVPYALPRGFGPDELLVRLELGPQGDAGVGLDSLIEPGLINSTEIADAQITVDLDPDVFSRITAADQREAIAQIVLTLSNLRGVGPVRFTIGGEPTRVTKGNGLLSGDGETVSADDYRVLLATGSGGSGTTTTTTVPPPPDTPPPTTVDPTATTPPG